MEEKDNKRSIKLPRPVFDETKSEENAAPDFELIKEFFDYPDTYKQNFKSSLRWFVTIPEYRKLSAYLKHYSLENDLNIIFFAIIFHRQYANMEHSKNANQLEDINKVILEYPKIEALFQLLKNKENAVESIIVNISRKGENSEPIRIESKGIISELLQISYRWFQDFESPPPPTNIKTQDSYFKWFTEYTFPLFNYMGATHHKLNKTKTKTYKFIVEFLQCLGVDFEKHLSKDTIEIRYLKDRYDGLRKKKATK